MFPFIATALGLAQFAPILGRWLSGMGAENVAAQVVDIAKHVTGLSHTHSIIQALSENPSLVIEFQKAIVEKETEWELALLKDRESARHRDLAWIRSGRRNVRADVMVISAALGLVFCLLSLAYYADHLPGEAVGIISTIAGIFGACLKDAYAFEFGSSRGSRDKDAALLERGG